MPPRNKPRVDVARPTARSLFLVAFAVVLAGVAFGVVLPRIASYGAVWTVVSSLTSPWLGGLAAAILVNVVTFAPPWMIGLPGLRFLDALKLTQASTAITLVVPGGAPLGMAASYAMLRSLHFDGAVAARAVALTGIWNQLSTFLFPVVGVAAVAAEGKGGRTFQLVAAIGGILFVLGAALVVAALASDRAVRPIRAVVQRVVAVVRRLRRRESGASTAPDFERFRAETVGLLRASWPQLTLATAVNQLTGFVVLDLSLRAVGIEYGTVSLADSFAAWSLGRLIASLPVTPGGLGLVELGLTGTLIGFGGARPQVVAAVLIYRILSIAPTLLLGFIAALSWRRAEASAAVRSRRRSRGSE
jgi:uncharacterized membrane protein YbhN (UPF0104 family)